MTTVKETLSKLPEVINGFDLITKKHLEIMTDKDSFIKKFNDIDEGWLDEVLISYDNHYFRYSMRISGRGDDLHLLLEYMEIIRDHVGPLSAQTLEEYTITDWDFEGSVSHFIDWVKKHSEKK